MEVVSISGPQGTGKTTLAKALAAALDAVEFSRDPLMDVLHRGGVPMEADLSHGVWGYPLLGYALQGALLSEQLGMGRSVVLECIAPAQIRADWAKIASDKGARFWIVETWCSDIALHRRRFEARGEASRGNWVLDWAKVEQTLRTYEPHPNAVFTADAVHPVEHNVRAILRIINPAGSAT